MAAFLALQIAAAIGCGVIGGVFYAFSTFVMAALARLPAATAIVAMQSINVVVLNVLFLGVFLGTAVACALVALIAILSWPQPGSMWMVAGSLLYLVGTILVTIRRNVPLNDMLATLPAEAPDSGARWNMYVRRWTAWNHARTAAAIAAAAAITVGVRFQAPA